MKKKKWFLLFALSVSLVACKTTGASSVNSVDTLSAYSYQSGSAMVTQDIEASIDFFKRYVGYKLAGRRMLDGTKDGKAYGYTGEVVLDYAIMVPQNWSRENPNHPGVSFVQISNSPASLNKENPKRGANEGEVVLSFSVPNIDEIYSRVKLDNVPIVSDLEVSATGKSKTLTLLSPSGTRVYLYGYISKK